MRTKSDANVRVVSSGPRRSEDAFAGALEDVAQIGTTLPSSFEKRLTVIHVRVRVRGGCPRAS